MYLFLFFLRCKVKVCVLWMQYPKVGKYVGACRAEWEMRCLKVGSYCRGIVAVYPSK